MNPVLAAWGLHNSDHLWR